MFTLIGKKQTKIGEKDVRIGKLQSPPLRGIELHISACKFLFCSLKGQILVCARMAFLAVLAGFMNPVSMYGIRSWDIDARLSYKSTFWPHLLFDRKRRPRLAPIRIGEPHDSFPDLLRRRFFPFCWFYL